VLLAVLPSYSTIMHLCTGFFGLEVDGDVAVFLFNISDGLGLSGGAEVESDFVQEFSQVLGQVSAGEVVPLDGVGKSIAFVDGHSVGDSISGIKHNTGCLS
jgi:hypothetical protein